MRQQILTRIEKKKLLLDAKRPLPKALSTNLEDRTRIDLTYHSNAIEGNTLTRQETALVVDEGLSINGKTVNEILEARGHDHALTLILE